MYFFSSMAKRDLISVLDMKDEWPGLVDLAIKLKAERGNHGDPLKGKTLAMMFEKPSTRTRISFDVAITELGGHALYIDVSKMQMGHGETVEDTAKVMSRFVHGIMYRAFDYKMMDKIGEYATIPVISGLDDLEHPCQALADMVTIKEKKGGFRGKKLVYLGDGNNVCNSLLYASAIMGLDMVACCPAIRMPNAEIMLNASRIADNNGSKIIASHEPLEACKDADIVYTDTWISMGDNTSEADAIKIFQMYQINKELLSVAKPDCIVMHCLPAHRGQEITAEVMDGPQSVVFDQAENRLHAQKAVLYTLLK
jgi:ornithine carbamoyltransferase